MSEPRGAFRAFVAERVGDSVTRGLRQLVSRVRKNDYCFASEEHELGVQALAVPLRDMQGHTVAALNVVLSGTRYQEETLQREMLPLLFEAAREVRSLL